MEVPNIELSEQDYTRLWLLRNRGVVARIADEHDVSHSYVRNILYGLGMKSRQLRIEKALIEAGAPFVQQRIGAAQ